MNEQYPLTATRRRLLASTTNCLWMSLLLWVFASLVTGCGLFNNDDEKDDAGTPDAGLSVGDGGVDDAGDAADERGALQSAERVGSFTSAQIRLLAVVSGVPSVSELDLRYDVDVYAIRYATVDTDGSAISASGALALPTNATSASPLASYQHGTILKREDAPSQSATGERNVAILMASAGYVTAAPDYLGLGLSQQFHPYVHAASEASAVVDMLRASSALAAREGVSLTAQLFLLGYSQGGHATLAAHRQIEASHSEEFQVTASAPGAGPYDLSGTMADRRLDAATPHPNPYYLPYTLIAMNRVYELFATDAEVFVAPFDQQVVPLFDGTHGSDEINALLPAAPIAAVKPAIVEAFATDVDDPVRRALQENDVHDWRPVAPVRLYHCEADAQIPAANAEVALAAMRARGATVERIDPNPAADHDACAGLSLVDAYRWFETLRP